MQKKYFIPKKYFNNNKKLGNFFALLVFIILGKKTNQLKLEKHKNKEREGRVMINDIKALQCAVSKSYAFAPLQKKEKGYDNNIFTSYHSKRPSLKPQLSYQANSVLNPLENYLEKQLRDKFIEDGALDTIMDETLLRSLEEGYSFKETNPKTGETNEWSFDKINNCYIKTVIDIYGSREKISIPKKQSSSNFLDLSPVINKLRSQWGN